MNQAEVELLSELYEENKTPEEMINEVDEMGEKSFAELAGDALRNVMKQLANNDRK